MAVHQRELELYILVLVVQLFDYLCQDYERLCQYIHANLAPSTQELEVALLHKKRRQRRRKAWVLARCDYWIKGTLNGQYLQDPEFQKTFRISRNSFEQLHALLGMFRDGFANVEPYITLQDTHFRLATPSRVRLLAFLYHIALGAPYTAVSHQFALGKSTVSKIVHDVANAILAHMWAVYIRLPSVEEAQQSIKEWKKTTGIPGIVGAIDGTHIAIKKPANRAAPEVYFNRKAFYSINVQGKGICYVSIANCSHGRLQKAVCRCGGRLARFRRR